MVSGKITENTSGVYFS